MDILKARDNIIQLGRLYEKQEPYIGSPVFFYVVLNQLDKAFGRDDRSLAISWLIGRSVSSTKELTNLEKCKMIQMFTPTKTGAGEYAFDGSMWVWINSVRALLGQLEMEMEYENENQ